MEAGITLKAEPREVTGKKVNRLRLEGWVPGVAYGPDMKSVAVQIVRKELVEAYRQAGKSALIGVQLGRKAEARPALIREVQRDALTHEIIHVDIEMVDMTRPITTTVPVSATGRAPIIDQGLAVLTHGVEELQIRCLPTAVPSRIEVDLSVLVRPDQAIRVADLQIPAEVHVLTDADTVVVYATSIRRLEAAEERATRAVEAPAEEAEAAAAEETTEEE